MATTLAIYNFDQVAVGDSFGQRSIDGEGNLVISPYRFKVNFDLTGYTIRIKFMKRYLPEPVKEIATGTGIVITAPADGEFDITPFIVDWASGITHYDVEFTSGQDVSTLIKGVVPVVDDIDQGSTAIVTPSPVSVSFIFPKGDKGEQGQKGDKGDTGSQGLKGDKGDTGDRGPMPDHSWDGTSLSFQKPDGSFDTPVDLKGIPGADANLNAFQVTVPTYAAMIAAASGSSPKVIQVLTDENKNQSNTVYSYFPGIAIMWNAAVVDVQL